MKITKISFIFFLVSVSFYVDATKNFPKILKMYEHFTLASAASGKCFKAQDDQLKAFMANYSIVMSRAAEYIRSKKADLTDRQVADILKNAGEQATKQVYAIIESDGCDSPHIQDLIQRFKVQSQWNPYEAS